MHEHRCGPRRAAQRGGERDRGGAVTQHTRAESERRSGAAEGREEEAKSERSDDKDDKERAVNELKRELSSSLISIRTEVGRLAQQVTALAGADAEAAAQPAAGELGRFEDTRALRKVIESLEQRMTRKLTQIDERLGKRERTRDGSAEKTRNGTRDRPPPSRGVERAPSAGDGLGGPPAEAPRAPSQAPPAAPAVAHQSSGGGGRRHSHAHSRERGPEYSNGTPGDGSGLMA